jgi:hypothetical protein
MTAAAVPGSRTAPRRDGIELLGHCQRFYGTEHPVRGNEVALLFNRLEQGRCVRYLNGPADFALQDEKGEPLLSVTG